MLFGHVVKISAELLPFDDGQSPMLDPSLDPTFVTSFEQFPTWS